MPVQLTAVLHLRAAQASPSSSDLGFHPGLSVANLSQIRALSSIRSNEEKYFSPRVINSFGLFTTHLIVAVFCPLSELESRLDWSCSVNIRNRELGHVEPVA